MQLDTSTSERKQILPKEFVLIAFAINIICLIMALRFCYQHYFHHNGKGFDDYLCALSIYSLSLFFAVMTIITLHDKEKVKLWIILGLIYTAISTLFIATEILAGQDVLGLVVLAGLIQSILFVTALGTLGHKKWTKKIVEIINIVYLVCAAVQVLFFGSWILGSIFLYFTA